MPIEERGAGASQDKPKAKTLGEQLFGGERPKTPDEAQERLREALDGGEHDVNDVLEALEEALGDQGKIMVELTRDLAQAARLADRLTANPSTENELAYKTALLALANRPVEQRVLIIGTGVQAMRAIAKAEEERRRRERDGE